MRFVADGPTIPDELLVARDEGDVLFFCSAGVSQTKARLPSFPTLGRRVIERLWPWGVEHTLDWLAESSETSSDPRLAELRRRREPG